MRIACLLIAIAGAVSGQSFEAASVKPAQPGVQVMMNCQGGPGTPSPARFTCSNAPLKMLICMAYDVQFYQVIAPDWSASFGYDIAAAVPTGASRQQFQRMLQALLAERFRLSLRPETKELPAYALVVARSGSRVVASGNNTAPAMITGTRGDGLLLTARRQAMKSLAGYLSVQLQTQVIDNTGLTGEYDFLLQFAPPQVTSAQTSSPSVFTALEEQLGVSLRAQRNPVPILVVANADRMPTEN